jgi:hypothetical protein
MEHRSVNRLDVTASSFPMVRRAALGLLLSSAFLGCGPGDQTILHWQQVKNRLAGGVNVLTYHNDDALTGLNPREEILTPDNVNATNFGRLFSFPVDGYVYAQPLYMSALSIGGDTYDVVIVATEHDSVYAFDADGLVTEPLWKRSFIDPKAGKTTVPTIDVISRDIVPEVGITGTPVIDGNTGILYVVPKTKEMVEGVAHFVQRLHALDVTTGLDVTPPVDIGDTTFASPDYMHNTRVSVCGRGQGSEDGPVEECPATNGKVVKFNALRQLNRPALTLSGNRVYVSWASHGDNPPYHGWVAAFNKSTLAMEAVFNVSPNGRWGGIWQSGGGLAVDSESKLYFSTGNGTFAINDDDPCPFLPLESRPCNPAFGDSVVKLSPDLTVDVENGRGYFTPFNQAALESVDADLGSGGTMLLPDQPGAHPHLLVETGKEGKIYLIDRDDMGGYRRGIPCPPEGAPECDDVVQVVPLGGGQGVRSTPAFFDNKVYYQGTSDVMKAFELVDGRLSATPVTQSNTRMAFPGASPSFSASGTRNGIAWALQTQDYLRSGPTILHVYEAVNLQNELYHSNQTGLRDQPGGAVKFTVPTIANGKVYVGTQSTLAVFGLFPSATTTPAAPSDLVARPLSFSRIQLSWTNHATNATGIKIERSSDGVQFQQVNTVARNVSSYTDDGLTSSTRFFYRVLATNQLGDSGYSNEDSAITGIQPPALQVKDVCVGSIDLAWTASPVAERYEIQRSPDEIAFETVHTVDGDTTHFTDGGLPLGSRHFYRVLAVRADGDSALSNTVGSTIGGPVRIDHSLGFDRHGELAANENAEFTVEGVARLTGDSTQRGSFFTTQRVSIRAFHTSFTFRLHDGTPTIADGLAFVIQGNSPTAIGPAGGGLGYGPDLPGAARGIRNSVAIKFDVFQNVTEGPNSTGIFTDGRSPTIRDPMLPPEIPDRSIDLRPPTSDVELRSQSTKRVDLTYDGTTLTETITDLFNPERTFTTSYQVDITRFVGGDTAFVGFTGATGGNFSLQDILTWTYDEDPEAEDLPPRRPAQLRVISADRHDADQSDITVAWLCNNAQTATGFSLERSSDGISFMEIRRLDVPAVSFTDTRAGGNYFYRVSSFNSQRTSAPSNVDSVLIGGGDNPTRIEHSDGFAERSDLTANGTMAFVGTFAQLTNGSTSPVHTSSFFSNSKVPITRFDTSFQFRITGAVGGDGMTFTIQGNSPREIGNQKGALGYQGIRDSVAIKFDILDNDGEGSNSTGMFTDGHFPSIARPGSGDVLVDLTDSGVVLRGHVLRADITYDGAALVVTITDVDTPVLSATQTYPVDLPAKVGGGLAYLGFTGASGQFSAAAQQVETWTFQTRELGLR